MTYAQALSALSSYPLPPEQLALILRSRGLHPQDTLPADFASDSRYQLARADTLSALSAAPNVSQEGISYDILETTRSKLREEAQSIYRRFLPEGDPERPRRKPRYGYRGSLLRR